MAERVFLFAYFVDNGQQGVRLAYSRDGLRWTDIPGLDFLIAPETGLMRDPFLMRGEDNRFHLIWTTDWSSQDIGYAVSNDLKNWSRQRHIPVMQQQPSARNCWAPEMIYDPTAQLYRVYWASTVPDAFPQQKETSEDGYNHRIWSVTTSDFETFSEPKIFFDPGFNVIDVSMLKTPDGTIRLVGKDERLVPERKNLFTCTAESYAGPFSQPSPPFTKSWVEGPASINIGKWTYVYYDVYRENSYEVKRTKDFQSWEDLSHRLRFPDGARHGSIVHLSPLEFQKLLDR